MTMKRRPEVLVAGGAGFIGSHLADRLIADGCRVVCLDSYLTGRPENLAQFAREPRFDLIEADVIDPAPDRLRPDQIYNLACAASPPHYQRDPEHTLLTCVVGTRNLLRLAERSGARFLQASTSEVYGDPRVHPQPETYRGDVNCTGPRACYDEGKRAAETLAYDFRRSGRADVRVARIFNTYGPRMRPDDGRVVSNMICQALDGLPLTIYGNGEQTRSFCYVEDLVEGLVRLMASDGALSSPVNLGNPEEMTVRRLAALVLEATGCRSDLRFEPLPVDDPRRRRPDIDLAATLLGWKPETPVTEGLARTAAFFREDRRRAPRAAPAAAPLAGGTDAVAERRP